MEALTYLLKVTVCTVLFFGFYLLVLRKLTFFKINRFYLLGSLLLSFVIPALQFEVKREMVVAETDLVTSLPEVKTAEEPVKLIQPIMVEYQPEIKPEIDWLSLIPYAYGAIASVLLLICLWRLFSLLKYARKYTQNSDGLKLITKTTGFTNCSFFNYVFINGDKLSDADLAVLLKHEQVHARQYHSADKILLMIAKALLWFNPVIYLYDKALEQVHEYEADEITSASFGNQAYASLLLQLAVTKTNNALIHNFVKSPVKDRIKMLFHSKSKNMKKLIYVLVLPIVLSLVYSFTVSYVDVRHTAKADNKTFQTDSLLGKSIEGVVLDFSKDHKLFNLKTASGTYSIEYNNAKNKLKIGDKVVVLVTASISPPAPIGDPDRFKNSDKITYLPQTIKDLKGSLIYQYRPVKYAFLYEVNKARYATSKIKSIKKDVSGKIETIVLNDGLFNINLNLKAQNIKDNNFKVGDEVSVKFIGERLVSKNNYTTDKMIVLYSEPKKYLIKNEVLYNRFYYSDGKQKVALKNQQPKTAGPVKPKIISFSKMSGNVKSNISYLEDAVIVISNSRLEAKNVELDMSNNRMIAKDAVLEKLDGKSYIKANTITFDLKNEDIKMNVVQGAIGELGNDNTHLEKLTSFLARGQNETEAKVSYVAEDSVKMSNDKSIISLYGNAKISYNSSTVKGSKIVYNKLTNTAEISDAVFTSNNDDKIYKAKKIYVDFNTSKPRYSKSGEIN